MGRNISTNMKRHFLVIRMGNIGDVLCASPLLRKLRLEYPESRIDFLTSYRMRDVIIANPNIDKVFLFKKVTKSIRNVYDHFFRRKLIRQGYTDVILLDSQKNEQRFALDFLEHSIDVYGFANLSAGNPRYHQYKQGENEHRINYFLRVFFREQTLQNCDYDMDLVLDNPKIESLKNEFGEWLTKAVMVHPRTTETPPYRGFDLESNAGIIESIVNKGYNVLLSGIDIDKISFDTLSEKFGESVKSFAGRSFDEFLSVIGMVKCVVAAETGTAHIARALKIPVLVIAGPTSAMNAGPIGTGIYGSLDLSCEQGPCWTPSGTRAKQSCMENEIVDCLQTIDLKLFNSELDKIFAANQE